MRAWNVKSDQMHTLEDGTTVIVSTEYEIETEYDGIVANEYQQIGSTTARYGIAIQTGLGAIKTVVNDEVTPR